MEQGVSFPWIASVTPWSLFQPLPDVLILVLSLYQWVTFGLQNAKKRHSLGERENHGKLSQSTFFYLFSFFWYDVSMLVDAHNPSFFEDYENGLRNKITQLSAPFADMGSLDADKMASFLKTADRSARKLRRYESFLDDRANYFKPVDMPNVPLGTKSAVRESRGAGLVKGGYYEMDSFFVQDMLEAGKFKVPTSEKRYTLRGAGSGLQEIHKHILHCLIFSSELLKTNSLVNVVESDDWELLALLKHIDPKFGLESYDEGYSQPQFRPASKYPGDCAGKERFGLLDTLNEDWYKGQMYHSTSALMKVRDGVELYRQTHDSFFFFEALLVDDSFAPVNGDWWDWTRELLTNKGV